MSFKLIRLLNFACTVIVPGRAFSRRIINLTIGLTKPHHRVCLDTEARANIDVWMCFLDSFNRKSLFLQETWVNSLELFTDASNLGYGAILGAKWLYGD